MIVPAASNGFWLVPANRNLTAAEIELLNVQKRERRLADALASADGFDWVLIDCPPSLSMLTVNAFVAAKSVIITMQ